MCVGIGVGVLLLLLLLTGAAAAVCAWWFFWVPSWDPSKGWPVRDPLLTWVSEVSTAITNAVYASPLTCPRRIIEVSVTGAIGAGKSTVINGLAVYFNTTHPNAGVRVITVQENADTPPFSTWLDLYVNGWTREDGTVLKASTNMFQMAVTQLRAKARAHGRHEARLLLSKLRRQGDFATKIVIVTERVQEDAEHIFIPANRNFVPEGVDRDVFDMETRVWRDHAERVGEPLPDATILLDVDEDTAAGRQAKRGRRAENGYFNPYLHTVWQRYRDSTTHDWKGGPTHVVSAEGPVNDIVTAVVDIVRTVAPVAHSPNSN